MFLSKWFSRQTKPPTKVDIAVLFAKMTPPHGHMALAALMHLDQDEREMILAHAEWFLEHIEVVEKLLHEMAAPARREAAKTLLIIPKELKPE